MQRDRNIIVNQNVDTKLAQIQAIDGSEQIVSPEAQVLAEIADDSDLEITEVAQKATAIRYHSWLSGKFLSIPMSSTPAQAGIRTAILGSIYMMIIVISVSLPIGVGTAVYLEEYANDSLLNRVIETNVRNLAGVPSIIYGLLGLSIFVRVLGPLMSGNLFGVGLEVPTDMEIADILESAVAVEILLDEDDEFAGVAEGGILDEAQAENLINTFRRIGTGGFSNPYGEISTQRAVTLVWDALDYDGRVTVEGNTNNVLNLEEDDISGGATFGDSTIAFDDFTAIASELKRTGSITVAGRTLLSAGLTLSLLILPIIIINAQEALRAVPYTFREASYGLGATKWQTIWRSVLPAAVPQIMIGVILAVSRAVGETAPLIVVGASTFILTDPSGPFSRFTVLPIQVYNWTARPQEQFQFIAAAAIIVLLTLVISLNVLAIILRNRYRIRY